MKKTIIFSFIFLLFGMLAVPFTITSFFVNKPEASISNISSEENVSESISENTQNLKPQTNQTKNFSKIELEDYVTHVVCAEMPALFEPEALKAQAVAARTYAYRKIKNGQDISSLISDGGQAYSTDDELKKKWGENFDKYFSRVSSAVSSTESEILTYEDEPILAVFHAISSGKTENSENVWKSPEPYLKTVDSSGDMSSPQYEYSVRIPSQTVVSLLQKAKPDLYITSSSLKAQIQIIDRTDAGYIKTLQIGNLIFTGNEVRNILSLRSSDFTIKEDGSDLIFTTKGYGHGAGMSQYGANCLAKDGKNYKEILSHYYTGVSFSKL